MKSTYITILLLVFIATAAVVFSPEPKWQNGSSTEEPQQSSAAKVNNLDQASKPTSVQRSLSSNEKIEMDRLSELQSNSSPGWQISLGENGFIKRMTSGLLRFEETNLILASHSFLSTYGKDLLGIDGDSVSLLQSNQDASNPQVVFEQMINGKRVWGTRVSFTYDSSGGLVYLQSDICSAAAPSNGEHSLGTNVVIIARKALLEKLLLPINSNEYSQNLFNQNMDISYRCSGNQLFSVYHFIIPLVAPHFGDMEIEVDAQSGVVTKLKNLAKN